MDLVELAFHLFKDEESKSRKHLKDIIKKKFKDITEKQLSEVTLRIYNYQIDKYGCCLTGLEEYVTKDDKKKKVIKAKDRRRKRYKYYENQGRR